jgi:DNA-binding transcriptional ArsR family regulator
MMPTFSFRLQAADGLSPAHVEVKGRSVPDDSEDERATAAEQIVTIGEHGKVVYEQGGAELLRRGDWVMIKVHANERDDAGRLAPILGWGRVAGGDPEEVGHALLAGLQQFAERVGRTVNVEHIAALERAFSEEKKHRGRKRIGLAVVIGTAVAVAWGAHHTDTKSDHARPTTNQADQVEQ